MKILFVCSGNVFRSLSAEYLMRKYIIDNDIKNMSVDSAGIYATPDAGMSERVKRHLKEYGVIVRYREPKRLTIDLIEDSDVIVAMSTTHKEFIREHFSLDVPLFNDICYGKKTSVPDVDEAYPVFDEDKWNSYTSKTIKHIHDSMPALVKNIDRFLKTKHL